MTIRLHQDKDKTVMYKLCNKLILNIDESDVLWLKQLIKNVYIKMVASSIEAGHSD